MRDPYAEASVERDRLIEYDTGLQNFMQETGRTDTDPYGYSGMFYESGKNRLLGREGGRFGNEGLTQTAIDNINRLAYDQYLGLVSGEGYRKGGKGDPVPGYAPALKIGSVVPGGTVQLAPQPEPAGALGAIGSYLKGGGIVGQLLGGGNRPRVFQPDEAPAQSLLQKANEKANEISNQPKINGGITGAPIDNTPVQSAPVQDIPGMYQTVGLDALGSSQYLPPALQDMLMRAGKLARDGGPSIGGNLGEGGYKIKIDPFGQDKSIQFNYKTPLQDLGIGKLFSQNMDPRQNFNVTV